MWNSWLDQTRQQDCIDFFNHLTGSGFVLGKSSTFLAVPVDYRFLAVSIAYLRNPVIGRHQAIFDVSIQ
jgi:hypothetical protein